MHTSLLSPDLIPVDVSVDDRMIHVRFNGGLEIATPVSRFPRLANASGEQRKEWRIIGRGDGIHWPAVDEDISVRTLLSNPIRKPASRMEEVPVLITGLLAATRRLNELFDGRQFTPDGHLVGSIGEVVAEYIYDVKLTPGGTAQVDAHTSDGRSVQIKLTGAKGTAYGFRWSSRMAIAPAEILIAMQLTKAGFVEVYNGLFPKSLLESRKDTSNGQVSINLSKLRNINPQMLPRVQSFDSINRWFIPELSDVA